MSLVRQTFASCVAAVFSLLALVLTARPACADRAVVVGIQSYPSLAARANLLRGCVSDAQQLAEALKSYKFNVTLLTNEQATRAGITAALTEARQKTKPGEKFVFYFAGHGSDLPFPCLLTYDTDSKSSKNVVTKSDLYNLVKNIPAVTKTVILDSCFSGGMSKSLDMQEKTVRVRYYALPFTETGGSKSPVPASGMDSGDKTAATNICYYTAAMGNEKSLEADFDNGPHGIFTYFLIKQLTGRSLKWEEVHLAVKSKVMEFAQDAQHPTITPAFLPAPIFQAPGTVAQKPENKPETKPTTKPDPDKPAVPVTLTSRSVWDSLVVDNPQPDVLKLAITPDKTTFAVNEILTLEVTTQKQGYLVLMERFVDGKVYVLFPKSRSADDAKVETGSVFKKKYQPDAEGTESVKALLFESKEQAQALLSAIPPDTNGVPFLGTKQLREVGEPGPEKPVYTSLLVFEVAGKQ